MISIRAAILIGVLAGCGPCTASTIRLADLVKTDELGYECIADSSLELAFAATGKGLRLPRTCLPEPCRVLSRERLGHEIIGRPPDTAEWDEYYARYAEHCRAETTPFEGAIARPTVAQFWAPLRRDFGPVAALLPPVSVPQRSSEGGGIRTGGLTVFPGLGGSGRTESANPTGPPPPPATGSSIWTEAGMPDRPDLGPAPQTIAAVPLPGSLSLLILLLAVAMLSRAVARSALARIREGRAHGAAIPVGRVCPQAWP